MAEAADRVITGRGGHVGRADAAGGAGTPGPSGAPDTVHAAAAVDAEDMARVTADFRQYLMGWGYAERGEGDLDHYRSGLAQPQFNGVVRMRSLDMVGQTVATARTRLADVPWWWVGPDSPEGTSAALAEHGAVAFGSLPVMIRPLDRVADPDEPLIGGLRIETVEEPGRLTELVRTYSASMGVAPGLEDDVVRIEAQRADNADIAPSRRDPRRPGGRDEGGHRGARGGRNLPRPRR